MIRVGQGWSEYSGHANPEFCRARALALAERVEKTIRGVELYQRVSRTTRARRDAGSVTATTGLEEGTALRRVAADAATPRFVSSAGGDEHTVDNLCALLDGRGSSVTLPPRESATLIDDEPTGTIGAEQLRTWLEAAPGETAWVESAATVEVWVEPGSVLGCRVRRRTWAMARLADGSTRWTAVRGPELPPPVDTAAAGSGGLPRGGGSATVVLRPGAVATLLPALVGALHADPARVGTRVGRGWSVLEDPKEKRALFGGMFDDVLDPAAPQRLAAGGRIQAALQAPGIRRRASVHDAPVPMPVNLRVDAPPVATPSGLTPVAQLHLYALDPNRWVLEIPGPRPRFVRTGPLDLARRCVGSVGEAVATQRGVLTAALVFEGLVFD